MTENVVNFVCLHSLDTYNKRIKNELNYFKFKYTKYFTCINSVIIQDLYNLHPDVIDTYTEFGKYNEDLHAFSGFLFLLKHNQNICDKDYLMFSTNGYFYSLKNYLIKDYYISDNGGDNIYKYGYGEYIESYKKYKNISCDNIYLRNSFIIKKELCIKLYNDILNFGIIDDLKKYPNWVRHYIFHYTLIYIIKKYENVDENDLHLLIRLPDKDLHKGGATSLINQYKKMLNV